MTERSPPPVTAGTPIGPDVDLDREDVRRADGTRLTEQNVEGFVAESGAAAADRP